MMRPERFGHVCRDGLDIWIPSHSLVDPHLVRVVLFPRPVHQLDLYQITNILVELAPVVNFLALGDRRKEMKVENE